MKPVRSLQFKIAASLFLVGAVLIVIAAARTYHRGVKTQRESSRAMAFAEGSRLSGMAQHLLRRQASRAADLELSYASTNPDLKLGVFCDGANVVRHATSQQLRGLPLARTPMARYAAKSDEVRQSMEGRVEELNGDDLLVALFPYWEGLATGGKGCVILEYDLRRPLAAASNAALWSSVAQALALTGGCLALWLVLKLVVTLRVEALVGQVQGMSLEADPAPLIAGNDELAQVSKAVATTHQRLRQSEQRFRQIATTMRDVFFVAPATPSESPYVNDAYQSMFGRDPAILQRRRWDWLRALLVEDRKRCLTMLRRLRSGGGRDEVEVRIVLPDDSVRWVNCRGFGVSKAADPFSVAGIVIDVTDQKMVQTRLLDTAEKERRRIGMDLHDDLCQRLAAAQLKAGILQSALIREGGPNPPLASELVTELTETIAIARNFARGLAPVAIEALGLPAALAELGEFIHRAFKIPCNVECPVFDVPISGETATHIFRIAQELITNVAKHAQPNWIEVSFEVLDHEGRLQITHDGKPFRPGAESKTGGMGLHLVQQRLDALGASLSYHEPRAGLAVASVWCLIPLQPHFPSSFAEPPS